MAKIATNEQYSDAESARRRDAVLKRMLNTRPQPKPAKPTKGATKPGRKRAAKRA
jgi:hypothetical protein